MIYGEGGGGRGLSSQLFIQELHFKDIDHSGFQYRDPMIIP